MCGILINVHAIEDAGIVRIKSAVSTGEQWFRVGVRDVRVGTGCFVVSAKVVAVWRAEDCAGRIHSDAAAGGESEARVANEPSLAASLVDHIKMSAAD